MGVCPPETVEPFERNRYRPLPQNVRKRYEEACKAGWVPFSIRGSTITTQAPHRALDYVMGLYFLHRIIISMLCS